MPSYRAGAIMLIELYDEAGTHTHTAELESGGQPVLVTVGLRLYRRIRDREYVRVPAATVVTMYSHLTSEEPKSGPV